MRDLPERTCAIARAVAAASLVPLTLASTPARAGEPIDPAAPWALRAPDLSPRGLDHDPTPGVLFVAAEGVTLTPFCGGPLTANAAIGCSPLVSETQEFPAYGDGTQRSVLFQKLVAFYADFDLVVSPQRPPDWLPYTMAVVGGEASQADQGDGVCGLANVACDGAKRNHVSLTFADSCAADLAVVAAQESAHNWGLEHVTNNTDIMYPFTAIGNPGFHDACTPISNETGTPFTQCKSVHRLYCPDGDGEEQNGHAELLGVFGPRVDDTTPPVIEATTPRTGDVWTTSDSLTVTATITDDSNFVGVKWTWIEGLPDGLDSYTRCTNDVCDGTYNAWKPIEDPFDFVVLAQPPAGDYAIQIEAMDTKGNWTGKRITFTVVEDDAPSETGTPGADSGEFETGPGWTANASGTAGDSEGDSAGTDGSGTESTSGEGGEGCACRGGGSRTPELALLLVVGLLPRRRRASA